MFIYRYLQTTGKNRLLEIFESKKAILFHLSLFIGSIPCIFIVFQEYWVTQEELKDLYKNCCPEIYEEIANRSLLGLKVLKCLNSGFQKNSIFRECQI